MRSFLAEQTIAVPPLLIVRAASAAIALSIGLSFVGVWLQFRRDAMLALARAWLVLGAYTSLVVLGLLTGMAASRVASFALVTFALLTGPAFLDAAIISANHGVAHRRRFWLGALLVVAVILAVDVVNQALPVFLVLCLVAAMVVVARAPAFAGRLGFQVGLAVLLLRFATSYAVGAFAPQLIAPPAGLIGFTAYSTLCTILAGYFMIVAVFSLERDAAVRERVALERGLAQSQRMDSMGRMASSVAHDFNNILATVLSASEAVAYEAATPTDCDQAAEDIRAAVERGTGLTRTLLAFARPSSTGLADFDPAQRLSDLMPMVERLTGRLVRVTCVIAEQLKAMPVVVTGDPVQFDQVILNLAANARDAMPEGGPLALSCDFQMTPGVPGTSRALPGPHVRLQVSDHGIGMPRDIADHIFEPFFTTKEPGKGTGLGLSTAFGFVRQARGEIVVESVVGEGSTFTILLPVSARPSPGTASA